MTRRPVLLLVNPLAGGKPGSGPSLHEDPERLRPEALEDALRERDIDVRLHRLTEDDDAGALARSAADGGNDVVVAGGDGTVSGVAAAMIGQPEASLGILAMGSFNNMARGFGIPVTLDEALDVIGAGQSTQVDAGWVVREGDDGRPFFEAAGVGVDAVGFLAVELAERRGLWRAVRSMLRALRLRKTPMRITLDDTAYRTGSPAVTVSNGPYHGAGFVVSAEADPTDGVLDVAVFHGMNRFEVIRHFLAVARRKQRREPRIRQYRAERVRIEGTRRALPAHADGVSIGFTPVTFEVRPGALRVFR
ncbi:MAG: diacylglycerol/lipid kinase family protein [Candidatus Limnocylindria bacterium]